MITERAFKGHYSFLSSNLNLFPLNLMWKEKRDRESPQPNVCVCNFMTGFRENDSAWGKRLGWTHGVYVSRLVVLRGCIGLMWSG